MIDYQPIWFCPNESMTYILYPYIGSPVSGSGGPNWFPASPTIGSKISRASRASAATIHGNENDVEELEMLLEVRILLLYLDAITFQLS